MKEHVELSVIEVVGELLIAPAMLIDSVQIMTITKLAFNAQTLHVPSVEFALVLTLLLNFGMKLQED